MLRAETARSPVEQRGIIPNVGWETYERPITEREERSVPRFFYDRGVLEIVSPPTEHEEVGHFLVAAVDELVVGWETDIRVAGHTVPRKRFGKAT
jgi:hypothetical protein